MVTKVVLIKVNKENIDALKNLYQLYQYDFNVMHADDLNSGELNEEDFNIDNYIIDSDKVAYLFRVENKIVGFTMLNDYPYLLPEKITCLSEFFVMEEYRRLGVGLSAAKQIFVKYPGRIILEVRKSNLKAEPFWNKAISSFGVKSHEIRNERYRDVDWNIHDIEV